MYKYVIVENETAPAKQLKAKMESYAKRFAYAGQAAGVDEAISLIAAERPDLVFLDIELNNGTGFDILKSFREPFFEIIVVTGFNEFAIEAFKWSAVDYLLKPISDTDLAGALQKVEKRILKNQPNQAAQISALMDYWFTRMAADQMQLSLPLIGEHVMVRPSDIVWLEARGSYTNLVFKDGNQLLIGKRIGEFEKKLSGIGFIRCHQTHIINWKYITKVLSSLGVMEIVLFSGQHINVSRRYQKEVKEALRNM